MKRAFIILFILAVVIGATVGSYYFFQPVEQQNIGYDPETTKVVTIGRDTLYDTVNTTGRIEPKAEVEMNFEIGGVVKDVLVERGQPVVAGTVLALLVTDDLELAIQQAEIDLAQQQAELDRLFEPVLEEKITAAQTRLDTARLRLADLQSGPDEDEIARAAVALRRAQNQLKQAQWAYDEVAYRGDVAAMPQANQLEEATLEFEAAQAEYNMATRGPTNVDIAETRSTLADAEAGLAELLQKPSAADIASRQASIQKAQLVLQESKRNLERTALVAPTDGVILDINIEPGERVLNEAQIAALVIADTSAYLLKTEVDELDISRIAEGQPAIVSLDALFGQEFAGRVTDISPRPVTNDANAIVTYEVTLSFDMPDEGVMVLPGMTANATVETRQLQDVVVVPNEAIQVSRENGSSKIYVEKLVDGTPQETPIELGLQGESVTEVVSGLNAGDEIIIQGEGEEAPSTPQL